MAHIRIFPQRGATLTEVLMGLGIVAGSLGVAAPAMQDTWQAMRLTSTANELLADLYLARAEALRRNRRVALCKSPDGLRCEDGGGWEQGWIIFHDDNNNRKVEPGEDLIGTRDALPRPLRLIGNQPVAKYISYSPLGVTKYTGGGFQAGTLTLCRDSPSATPARQVVLNAVGRPRVQKARVAAC